MWVSFGAKGRMRIGVDGSDLILVQITLPPIFGFGFVPHGAMNQGSMSDSRANLRQHSAQSMEVDVSTPEAPKSQCGLGVRFCLKGSHSQRERERVHVGLFGLIPKI